MRVALVHGYFLHDSGSGIYVRELAHALVRLGHEVTLVCQEREPQRYDFIDSAYVLDAADSQMREIHRAPVSHAGRCRLVRPHLGGKLLVYVDGPFPGFAREDVAAFQDASAEDRDRYVASNVLALRTVFAEWPPELVLAQHLIMQPFVVRTALAGAAPYLITEHGSALNYSVRERDALVPFALEGLAGAAAVAAVSPGAREDLVAWSAQHGLDIAAKTVSLPPGIDAALFSPAGSRREAIDAMLWRVELPAGFDVRPDDDILVFAGALLGAKGVQHAIAALPLIAQHRGRRQRLLIAGVGPARAPLEELSALTAAGDTSAARRTVAREEDLRSPQEWGDVVAEAPPLPDGPSVAFLGRLDHDQLSSVFAAADVALVPSVFPEAAALVNAEALSAGALPLAACHSGMVSLCGFLAETLQDDALASLTPGDEFTCRLATLAAHVLDRYPTADPAFRMRLHETASGRYPTWERTADAYLSMAGPGSATREATT
jgi:glycosyltransferase involved in cell wall biosynthesis